MSPELKVALSRVVAEIGGKPSLWPHVHLGFLLMERSGGSGAAIFHEMRGLLGLSGPGTLRDWSEALPVEEALAILKRLLAGGASPLTFTVTSCSEQNQRPEQADRLLVSPFQGGLLAAVMDGVGSRKGGDVAAETVRRALERRLALDSMAPVEEPEAFLHNSLADAVRVLKGLNGATTCTALLFLETGTVQLAHVGDSAAFRLRAKSFASLTTPNRKGRRFLTHAIHGEEHAPHRAICAWRLERLEPAFPGDVFLLATDGCYEEVGTEDLTREMREGSAGALVGTSISEGSTDNSTAVVVHVRCA